MRFTSSLGTPLADVFSHLNHACFAWNSHRMMMASGKEWLKCTSRYVAWPGGVKRDRTTLAYAYSDGWQFDKCILRRQFFINVWMHGLCMCIHAHVVCAPWPASVGHTFGALLTRSCNVVAAWTLRFLVPPVGGFADFLATNGCKLVVCFVIPAFSCLSSCMSSPSAAPA